MSNEQWARDYGGAENMMAVIQTALEMSGDLTGFTLFEVKDGWQMSLRLRNEAGWIVKKIPAKQAQAILATLEAVAIGSVDPRFEDITNYLNVIEVQDQRNRERFLWQKAGIMELPTLDELIADWKAAVIENMEVRNAA